MKGIINCPEMTSKPSEKLLNTSKFQFLAAISGNLMILGYGTSFIWPAISFGTLQSELTPLDDGPLSTEEISWIVSIFCFGGFLGTICFGAVANALGRKTFLCLLAVPQIFSWVLIVYATDVYYLYWSRLLSGASGGAAYIFVPLLVAEIAEDRVRGTLGTIITVSCNFGVVLGFLAAIYLKYTIIPYVMMCIPVVFLVVFMWFPESPTYLMLINEPKKAENALRFYRNCRRDSDVNSEFFQYELARMRTVLSQKEQQKMPSSDLVISDFCTRPALMAFLITLTIFTMNECSGSLILISYTSMIFAESGSAVEAEWSAVVVAVIQLAGTYLSSVLIDRAGRKPLLIFSSLGCTFSLVGLGTYVYLNQLGGYQLDAFNWIPLVTFSALVFLASCGIIPISFVIMTEVMPAKIRGVGSSICLGYSWIMAFVLVKYFPILSESIGLHMCIAFFAFSTVCGTLFVLFVMPETKGKSFEEIQQKLEKTKNES